MSGYLRGGLSVITGAGSGIGKGIALMMAQQGARIAVCDMNLSAAQSTVNEIRDLKGEAVAVEMDVTSEEQVQEGFRKLTSHFNQKRVDVLVANAGFQHISPIEEFSFAAWKKMVVLLSFPSISKILLT